MVKTKSFDFVVGINMRQYFAWADFSRASVFRILTLALGTATALKSSVARRQGTIGGGMG
jgi:hypothetical protein